VARPDLPKDDTLPDTRSGHAWCMLRVKSGVELPPRTREAVRLCTGIRAGGGD